jgi:hypothetical protein
MMWAGMRFGGNSGVDEEGHTTLLQTYPAEVSIAPPPIQGARM